MNKKELTEMRADAERRMAPQLLVMTLSELVPLANEMPTEDVLDYLYLVMQGADDDGTDELASEWADCVLQLIDAAGSFIEAASRIEEISEDARPLWIVPDSQN